MYSKMAQNFMVLIYFWPYFIVKLNIFDRNYLTFVYLSELQYQIYPVLLENQVYSSDLMFVVSWASSDVSAKNRHSVILYIADNIAYAERYSGYIFHQQVKSDYADTYSFLSDIVWSNKFSLILLILDVLIWCITFELLDNKILFIFSMLLIITWN